MNRGKGPVHQSVCPSRCTSLCIPPWWLDGCSSFEYHDQVPWATDTCKLEFGFVLNLSNYGHFFLTVECLLWYLREECGNCIYIWYSYQIPCVAPACKIAFGYVPNLWPLFHIYCVFVMISQRRMWWFYLYLLQYQVWCITHVCKIVFGSVPHLSNYGYFFRHFVHLLWYLREKYVVCIHMRYHVLLMDVK